MASVDNGNVPVIFEDEYYLLSSSDLLEYPLIYEDCHQYPCSRDQYDDCEKVPDCPAWYMEKEKVKNPQPFVLNFITDFTKKKVKYADCYFPFSISGNSFVVSPKLYDILQSQKIAGIQFIPVILLEGHEVKYTDFRYVHIYNILPVLSEKNSRCQVIDRVKVSNNLLQIKFASNKMAKIKLENRLIFKFPLKRSYYIFHTSIVEKINSINPVGLDFIQISQINLPNTDATFI
jgi:hypothetical protein